MWLPPSLEEVSAGIFPPSAASGRGASSARLFVRGRFLGVVWRPGLLGSAVGAVLWALCWPVLGCTARVGFKLLFASGRSVISVCWL